VNLAARAGRRARILVAARRCFAREGFAAASVADIGAEAGISVAGLYQHFPSKQAIVAAIVAEDMAADLAAIERLRRAPSLPEGIVAAIRSAPGEPEVTRLRAEIFAAAGRDPELAATVRAAESAVADAVTELLAAAAHRGEIAPAAAGRATALLLLGLVEGVYACRALGLEATEPAFDAELRAFLARALGMASPTGATAAGATAAGANAADRP
jgi:AcrR family transcriptional regulator